MSVQMNQYLGFGYMLDYDGARQVLDNQFSEDELDDFFTKYYDSAFEKKIVEVNGFSMIPDGMDGRYIFFGKIFKKSTVYEPLSTTVMPKITTKMKKALSEEFNKLFGDMEDKPATILLTHYR